SPCLTRSIEMPNDPTAAPPSYGCYIDGAWEAPEGGEWIDSHDPSRAETWCRFAAAGEQQTARAVEAARTAFTSGDWPKMGARDRAGLLRTIADRLLENAEHLARTETVDCGKIITETRGFVRFCASYYTYYADMAD